MSEELAANADQIARHDYWYERVIEKSKTLSKTFNVLEKIKPEKAVLILMMLEESASYRDICERVGVNTTTISKIKSRYAETIHERRKDFSRTFATVAEMASDLMMKKMVMLDEDDSELKKTPLKDLALVAAIATDKGGMLDGMPTVTIEHRKGSSFEDALKLREAARQRLSASSVTVDAEVLP